MPEITSYEPGTPSWVDLGSPDVEASKVFYAGLFGWEAHTSPDPQAGGYTMFVLRDKSVAGLGPLFTEGDRPSWTTYMTTADADATASTVGQAGGTVIMPPFDVLDAGRMAVCLDNAGARFSIWQPGTHIGAELVNEPGTLTWNELATSDVDGAKAFYGTVFGWAGKTQDFDGTTYTMWLIGERPVGGMIQMNESWPADLRPHWMVYFAVADVDAAAARVTELGGSLPTGPKDASFGRFAVCTDPHGAVFSIVAPTAPS
jgi:uncharacterized protein